MPTNTDQKLKSQLRQTPGAKPYFHLPGSTLKLSSPSKHQTRAARRRRRVRT